MKPLIISGTIVVALIACAPAFVRAASSQTPENPADVHVYQSAKELKWGPAPPLIPKGAEAVVLDGNPFGESGAYTLRLKMPSGYKIPPHWHPTDERDCP
jgi:hypothetical protein